MQQRLQVIGTFHLRCLFFHAIQFPMNAEVHTYANQENQDGCTEAGRKEVAGELVQAASTNEAEMYP